jgi:polyvinyl alcohol dehydrogenase (cytochrome)
MKTFARIPLLAALLVILAGYTCQTPEHATGDGVWKFWGGNLHNTHHAESETRISVANVASLRTQWVFRAKGAISAIPTLSETELYVTDWGGHLHALERATGREIWSRSIASYAPHRLYNLSRSSPAIAGDRLVFGDLLLGPIETLASLINVDPTPSGTTVYAVDRATGALAWKTNVESHPTSQITQSPVVHDGRVYVGVSSKESAMAKFP